MKIGRNLQGLAAEIARQRVNKTDVIVDTRHLVMHADATMFVPQVGQLALRDLAHHQLADKLDIPNKYYERMRTNDPELLGRNVNHWLQKTPERRMVRMLDGSIRAFLSDKYQRIDNHDVAEVAIPLMGKAKVEIVSCEITEHKLYLKGTCPTIKAKVTGSKRRGDIVQCGIVVSNSEVGKGAISVKPFYYFLACENGMIGTAFLRAAHLGGRQDDLESLLSDSTRRAEDKVVLMKLKDVIGKALDPKHFAAEIKKMSDSTKDKLEGDVPGAVEVLSNELSLNENEKSSVLKHLIAGGDLSRYGLINAVTRTAEDSPDYDRATELEEDGYRVLTMPTSTWRDIAHATPIQ